MTTAPGLRATIVLVVACGTLTVGACSGSTPSPPSQPAASSINSATAFSAPTSPAPSTAATGSASSPTAAAAATSPPASPPASPSAPPAAAISIKDFMFTVPASVAPGATVTVTNADAQSHTVTSKDGGFDVKVDGHGGVATLTAPQTAGTYTLTCDFHSNMTGSLTVK